MPTSTITPLTLDTPLVDVLGPDAAAKLSGLGVETLGDLVTYWPRRWRERGEGVDLALVPDGQPATARVVVKTVHEQRLRSNARRRFLKVACVTEHGRDLEVSLYSPWQARKDGIKAGATVTFSGKVTTFRPRSGPAKRQMSNPEYVLDADVSDLAGTIVTVYPASSQAPSSWIADQIAAVLDRMGTLLDPLPANLLWDRGLPSYDWAVRHIHRPDTLAEAELAKHRLTYDEAFAVQLALAVSRHGAKATPTRALAGVVGGALDAFDGRLPFELTPGQALAGDKLAQALSGTAPTNALVEGEVGSGKTLVAVRAMLQAVDSGAQCAFVAPTEVLAAQHFEGLTSMLDGLDVTVALLTGSMPAARRREVSSAARAGQIDILVGTHALTNDAPFDNLGLVVVDEQHRFGVAARDALRAQPIPPHMIVMTATPIPRTLAMTVYGDLDIVEVPGLPAGRQPIQTVVIPTVKQSWVTRLWQRIGEQIAQGRQAFIVASLIERADSSSSTGADDETVNTAWSDEQRPDAPPLTVAELVAAATESLPGARIASLHGRMDPADKHAIMARFAAGDLDVLVSTTVIEVGVNVPNATVMAVWDADRFGIAQLHQLRGRVGRGHHPGLCLLVTGAPDGHASRERLDVVAGTLDGHKLATADLKTRREGDVLGTGQAGRSRLKLLDLTSGVRLIQSARRDAQAIVKADPALRVHRPLAAWLDATIGAEAAQNLTRS